MKGEELTVVWYDEEPGLEPRQGPSLWVDALLDEARRLALLEVRQAPPEVGVLVDYLLDQGREDLAGMLLSVAAGPDVERADVRSHAHATTIRQHVARGAELVAVDRRQDHSGDERVIVYEVRLRAADELWDNDSPRNSTGGPGSAYARIAARIAEIAEMSAATSGPQPPMLMHPRQWADLQQALRAEWREPGGEVDPAAPRNTAESGGTGGSDES